MLPFHSHTYYAVTLLIVALIGVSLVVTGCGTSQVESTAIPPSSATTTSLTPTPVATPTAAPTATGIPPAPTLTASAAATLTVGEILAELHTSFATAAASNTRAALTTVPMEQTALARPTPTLYVFPTPWPTSPPEPTPVVGLQYFCAPQIHGFYQSNCWIVRLGNEYIYVDGGYLYNVASGDLSDTSIGVIIVFTRLITLEGTGPTERYLTPQRLGPVHIAGVDGSRVTVLPDNAQPTPVVFVFDLATRQWVNP